VDAGVRERGWELEGIGTVVLGIGWLARIAATSAGGLGGWGNPSPAGAETTPRRGANHPRSGRRPPADRVHRTKVPGPNWAP